jgi:nanoRNase/pAp phosphatase (c-di-AMP/oligoRNAs hydrolase)
VNAYVRTLPHQLDAWERARVLSVDEAATLGAAVLAHERLYVEETANTACMGRLFFDTGDRHADAIADRVPFVCCSFVSISDVLDQALKNHPECPYAAGWRVERDGDVVYSLRSRSGFDVSSVAKRFGGGGHAAAAGFRTSTISHTWERREETEFVLYRRGQKQ